MFFGQIRKTRWPPWPLIGWDIFDFSSETAERKFNETWQKATSKRSLPSLCFSGRSEIQDGRPSLWLAETFFDFSSETAERNSTKLNRKQDLNVLYQVCVFRADRINKMVAPASDWLRHFQLLLWNRWTEFNETWQEATSQCPATKFMFFGPIGKNKMAALASDWLRHFSTSPLKPLNGIKRNLIGNKIRTSSIKFVCVGPIGKRKWPPWPLIGWDIFDFSSETTERN